MSRMNPRGRLGRFVLAVGGEGGEAWVLPRASRWYLPATILPEPMLRCAACTACRRRPRNRLFNDMARNADALTVPAQTS